MCVTDWEVCPKEIICMQKRYHWGEKQGGWGKGSPFMDLFPWNSFYFSKTHAAHGCLDVLMIKGEQAVGNHPQVVHMAHSGESVTLSWSKGDWQEFSLWKLQTKWRWGLPMRAQLEENMFPLKRKFPGIQVNPQEMESLGYIMLYQRKGQIRKNVQHPSPNNPRRKAKLMGISGNKTLSGLKLIPSVWE